MSAEVGSGGERTVRLGADGTVESETFRLLALGSVLVLTASYVSVLREVTRVVGGTESLFALVGAMVLAATVLARAIRPRTAALVALVAGSAGFAYYLDAAGVGVGVVLSATDDVVADTLTLATGLPLLQMVEAGTWTLAFAPAPAFLSWYLALRGRYALSVLPGAVALGFLVLTGDADTTVTLLGTLAAMGTIGFGELARRGGSIAQVDLIAVLFAAIIVLSLSVTFVPGGPANPTTAAAGDEGTLEGTIDAAPERSGIAGEVDLSPEHRFTVESERPSYWRTGVYDRFTGDEWLRSGQESPLDGPLEAPPGRYETVEHVVHPETDLGVMPVAAQPLSVDGAPEDATVSTHGQPHPNGFIGEDDSYVVESAVVDPHPDELQRAGTDYPDEIEEHYLQRPESASSEFDERTAEITADAETPYEKAVAIEEYLRDSKEYSLEVDRPSGDVAEAFLLEMDEGYCVYYATAMTQMLRAEDVPARYVTGYTSGEQVDDDTYVVRGLDAHAWVEVYFPGHGWVPFEPTPPADRDEAHAEPLEDPTVDDPEREDPAEDDDATDEEEEETDDNESQPDERNQSPAEPPEFDDPETDGGGDDDGASDAADEGDDGPTLPVTITAETVAVATVVLVGLVAGAHRTDATRRARRVLGCYWHGRRGDPDRDAVRAYRRLERLLAREHRPRRPGESARGYLEALADGADADALASDPRARVVLERYERAVYGGGVDRETADEAVAAVDALARERLPVVGRWRS